MSLKFLFADFGTGLWIVDEATGAATNLTSFSAVTVTQFSTVTDGARSFFSIGDELGVTAGTSATTNIIETLPDNTPTGEPSQAAISGLTALSNGKIAFGYFDGGTGSLYLSDGTVAGTTAVTGYSISGAAPTFGVGYAADVSGTLVFENANTGFWDVNETTGAAANLKSFSVGTSGVQSLLAASGGKAYFASSSGSSTADTQLWSSGGTSATTALVKALPDNTPSGQTDTAGIKGIVGLSNGKVLFSYYDGVNLSVYLSDGTAAGTAPITGYAAQVSGPLIAPGSVAELGGSALFEDGDTGLWSVNETTGVATNLTNQTASNSAIAAAGTTGYFGATTNLWSTNGTAAGTGVLITLPDNTPPGSADTAGVVGLVGLGDGKAAIAYDDNGGTLSYYLSDGTAAGTSLITGFSGTMLVTPVAGAVAELNVACFAAGTRIETNRGSIAVEKLRVGDAVLTETGASRPIIWLGHRRTRPESHPRPWDLRPVRIRAGAVAHNVPARDLLLSPDHAVFADGVLIPARCLINGITVVQERCHAITYWHVELASHDIVLAEGLPCETYLDTGNRGAFANAATVARLHPDVTRTAASAWARDSCAPLVEDGPILTALRARLATRAAALDDTTATVPEIALTPGCTRATVPAAADTVRLVSSSTRQGADRRRLGALVTGLRIDGEPVVMHDGRLQAGFHEVEHHGTGAVRWTDGAATLVLGPAPTERTVEIDVLQVLPRQTEHRAA